MREEHAKRFYAAVGKVLTRVVQSKKLSVAAISRASGEQYTSVQRMLKGERFMLHTIAPVATVLGITVDEIIKLATTEGTHDEEVAAIEDLI